MRGILAGLAMVVVSPVGLVGQEAGAPRKASPATSMAMRLMRKDSEDGKGKRAVAAKPEPKVAVAQPAKAEPQPAAKPEPNRLPAVVMEPKAGAAQASKVETKPVAKPEPKVAASQPAKAEPQPAAKPEPNRLAVVVTEPKVAAAKPAKAEPQPAAKPEPNRLAVVVTEPKVAAAQPAKAQPAAKPEPKPSPAVVAAEPKSVVAPVAKVEGKPAAKPEPKVAVAQPAKAQPAAKPETGGGRLATGPQVGNPPHKKAEDAAPVSGKPPVVVWRRDMSPPQTPAAEAPEVAAAPAPQPRVPSRGELVAILGGIGLGAPRAEVFAKLGKPAYAIAMSDGGSLVERCRFRSGNENLASIEFRDGVVASINRLEP